MVQIMEKNPEICMVGFTSVSSDYISRVALTALGRLPIYPFERHFIVNFVIKHSGPIKPPKSGPKILVLPFPPISDRARGTSIYQSYIKLHYKLDIPNE